MGNAQINKGASGRPSSLTKVEEQRYATLRSWGFSQREAGTLARNLSRGRGGARRPLSASTCQRLDSFQGPYAKTLTLPRGHSAESLRELPELVLVALADARGDVNSRKYLAAAGLRAALKRAKRQKKPIPAAGEQSAQAAPRKALSEESITFRAWNRAQFVALSVCLVPARTLSLRLKNMREWCSGFSTPVVLDADARQLLTPWERIAATWDGEFISDNDRKTLLLPFRNAEHPNITAANREAILAARDSMHSERPESTRRLSLLPIDPDGWEEELIHLPVGVPGEADAGTLARLRAEREAMKRIMRWAGDDAGEWQVGPFDVDYDQR